MNANTQPVPAFVWTSKPTPASATVNTPTQDDAQQKDDALFIQSLRSKQVHRRAKPRREHRHLWMYTKEHAQLDAQTTFWFLRDAGPQPITSFVIHNIRAPRWSYRQPCGRPHGFCPVCDYRDSDMADFCIEDDREQYAANILMHSDPVCPDNNGKVFVLEFGVGLFDIIELEIRSGIPLFNPSKEGTLFQLRGVWKKNRPPDYRVESMALPDSPSVPRSFTIPAVHPLADYPLHHDDEELAYQFSRVVQSLNLPVPLNAL